MKALIIDDENHCIEALEILLGKYCQDVQVVATCRDGICGLESIKKHEPDLVFLDIAMPRMNGFDMLSKLDDIRFEIIFTTAYDNYAIRAFKVSAVDYLLKPVERNELVAAVNQVKERIFLKTHAREGYRSKQHMASLLENLRTGQQALPNLAIPTLEGLEIIKIEHIIYVVGEGNYCQIHLKDRAPFLISKTIKYIEDRVEGHPFLRIHNSSLINLKEVKKYLKGAGGQVVMSDGKALNVSRNRKDDLLAGLQA